MFIYERNETSDRTLDNWINKFDLYCDKSILISSFQMMFFGGWTVSSLFLPSLGDKYGRKKVFLPCVFVNMICFVIPMVLPAKHDMVYIIIGMQFINGMRTGGMMPIGYALLLESLPLRSQTFYGTFWMMLDGSTYIFLTIYYRYKSHYWINTFYFGLTMQTIGFLGVMFIVPESPRWLYNQ